jgi:nucleotide-binding universal stress UspA family protein
MPRAYARGVTRPSGHSPTGSTYFPATVSDVSRAPHGPEARDRIAALGDVEPHAAYGDPAEELALYSASLDLLVVGSRDYGPLGRLVHGSTTRKLARVARSPLLVLTRAARKAEAERKAEDRGEAAVAATS